MKEAPNGHDVAAEVKGAKVDVQARELTVDIRIKVRAADDSPLAPVAVAALLEFVEKAESDVSLQGLFESKAGADVMWRAINRFYDSAGKLVGVVGINEFGGRLIDTMRRHG